MSIKHEAGTSTPGLSCPVVQLSKAFDPFDSEPYPIYTQARRGPEHVLVTWDPRQNPVVEDRP